MSTKTRTVVVLTAALSLLSVACASVAADSPSKFPTGRYQHGPNIVVFKADGTFVGTTPKNEDWVKGTYTNKGNEMTVVDTWEGTALRADGEDCMGKPGRYAWVKTGNVLKTTVVEDACAGRKRGTDGVAWTQVK